MRCPRVSEELEPSRREEGRVEEQSMGSPRSGPGLVTSPSTVGSVIVVGTISIAKLPTLGFKGDQFSEHLLALPEWPRRVP